MEVYNSELIVCDMHATECLKVLVVTIDAQWEGMGM